MEDNVDANVHDEFWDDTSVIINLRDVELPDVLEEDYSIHEYVSKEAIVEQTK